MYIMWRIVSLITAELATIYNARTVIYSCLYELISGTGHKVTAREQLRELASAKKLLSLI